ncbi:MAG: ABC transporter ATP-binding protein [Sphaerochaetaceae bacterium]
MSDYFCLSDLSFSYKGYGKTEKLPPVLKDLSLRVKEGSRTLILGPPDSGKTTLARIACGLLPRYIEGYLTGKVLLKGEEIPASEPWLLADKLTYTAQNVQEQLLMTTCGDEVAFPLESLAIERQALIERVEESLNSWGLLKYKDVNPQELSGGERKRLLLAVTAAIDAPLWIMDEPFDDLDEQWRQELKKRLLEKKGTVIVFASRYIKEADSLFDNYYLLNDTRLSEESRATAFSKLQALDRGTALNIKMEKFHQNRELRCEQMVIGHERRSTDSTLPFTLKIDRFSLKTGEVVALVGPNGAGKSTFSRVLCGLKRPQQGSITLDGESIAASKRLAQVAYLFQNPDYGIFLSSVEQELGWSLRHSAVHSKQEQIASAAKLFDLNLDENPSMMSYGKRKQLQGAVYYILNRPFVIIDEVDSGITSGDASKMVALLKQRGSAVVVITHDRSFAKQVATRQYKIVDGQIIESEVGQ